MPEELSGDDIEKANQAAFDSLMQDCDQPTRDWILKHVREIGIPMRSRGWLPAALAARTYHEIRTAAKSHEKAVQSLRVTISDATASASSIEQRLREESADRAGFNDELQAFFRRFALWLAIAIVLGIAVGAGATHWIDSAFAHTSSKAARHVN